MLGRGRASFRSKVTLLHPEQQECMWATISRPTLKCSSFKKKIKKEKKRKRRVMWKESLCHKMASIQSQNLSSKIALGSGLESTRGARHQPCFCWAELESAELSSLLGCFQKCWAQVSGHEGMLKPCFSWDDAQDLITAAQLSLLRQSPLSASLLVPATMGSLPACPPEIKLLPKK